MEIDEDTNAQDNTGNDTATVQDVNNNESGPPNLKPTKQRADVWKHFCEIVENGVKYSRCNHCLRYSSHSKIVSNMPNQSSDFCLYLLQTI